MKHQLQIQLRKFVFGLEGNKQTSLCTIRDHNSAMADKLKEIQAKFKTQLAQGKKAQEKQMMEQKLQEATTTPLAQMDSWKMTHGKYEGMTFKEIRKDNGYLGYVKYLSEKEDLQALPLKQLLIYAHRHLEQEPQVLMTAKARGSEVTEGPISWEEVSMSETDLCPDLIWKEAGPVENEVISMKLDQQEMKERMNKIENALGTVIQMLQSQQAQPSNPEAEGP